MSATNALETELLDLIFTGSAIADIADNDATSPATNLYVSLHTSDPGETGVANTNETAYTNYARVAVARTSGGWTVSGNLATNAGAVTFPACGVTGATITHFGISIGASGATVLLFKGALSASLAVSAGITPAFAAGEIDVTAD
jgi:hypothetical protein